MTDRPSSTLTDAPSAAPSTNLRRQPVVEVGDTVLVKLEEGVRRPLLITRIGPVNIAPPMQPEVHESRVSGILFCEPDDHSTIAVRTLGQGSRDPARITGRPDRHLPLCYAEDLREGMGIGEWIARPTRLPSRS